MDRARTARHACSPPRTATFFSMTCSAVRLTTEDGTSAPKPRETAKARKLPTKTVVRDIDDRSFVARELWGIGESYWTKRPSARNCPITTLTRCPGFTCRPLFEKAIQ